MRCYKCNSVLSETNFCNSCGTDVTLYKKIVRLSNTYYNMGLAKARVRDLSGAADILRRSVPLIVADLCCVCRQNRSETKKQDSSQHESSHAL